MEPRTRRWAVAVFAFALLLRLLYLEGWLPILESRQTPVYGDAAGYYLSALVLGGGSAEGDTVARLDQMDAAEWSRAHSLEMMSSRGPGYMLFLAAMFALFGEDPWPVRYAQALLGALTCAVVTLVGRHVAGHRVGLIAGLSAAIYPSFILFTGRILTEGLSAFWFWLGMLLLLRGLRASAPSRMALAGGITALACLTRPTLLAAAPFLILAAALAIRGEGWRRRGRLVLPYAGALLIPLVSWSLVARTVGERPIAGPAGLESMTSAMRMAPLPLFRGWSPDRVRPGIAHPGPESPADWERRRDTAPLYPFAAAANLVFYHLWFLENLWREIPPELHWMQYGLAVLALFGLGIGLLDWRRVAPVLFLLIPLVVVSVKWIEIRPNLPFMPVLFLLAGLCISTLVDRLTGEGGRRRRILLIVATAATALALGASRLPLAATLLPFGSPLLLGLLGDGVVVAAGLAWGAVVAVLLAPEFGRSRALLAGFVPATLFALLFASYAYVGSEPRWRSWKLDLDGSERTAVHRIRLHRPLATGRIASAVWLVDLETTAEPPPLEVGVDGVWLPPGTYTWKRLFCRARDPSGRPRQIHPRCAVYEEISRFTGALESSPQWWGIPVDPNRLGGGREISLMLRRRTTPGRPARAQVELGGALSTPEPGRFFGPMGIEAGPSTSLYRWHVADDWRLWMAGTLDSQTTESRLGSPDGPPDGVRALSRMMEAGHARFNILLRVDYTDGSRAYY